MRKIGFLIKLEKKKKLQEVEPSDEIKQAYLQRSNESLSSARALLSIGNLKDSVALAYYAMYHCLLAALFGIGIKCENHTAAILLLSNVFGIDNTQMKKAKSERIDKQYYVDFKVNKQETEKSIRAAEDFINEMNDFIATLSGEKIREYHQKAVSLWTEKEKQVSNNNEPTPSTSSLAP